MIYSLQNTVSTATIEKKAMKRFSLLLLTTLLCSSILAGGCHQRKQQQKMEAFFATRSEITIGQGGGFTGGVTKYNIANNGLVTKIQTYLQDTTLIGQLEFGQLTTIDRHLNDALFLNTQFNQPGNLYKFISMPTDESNHVVTWGDYRQPAPEPIQQAYDGIMEMIKALEKTDGKE